MPFEDSQLIKENLKRTKAIITSARIGADAQGIYEMRIGFGSISIKNMMNDNSLKDCIPNEEAMDWVTLDIRNKSIELRLK